VFLEKLHQRFITSSLGLEAVGFIHSDPDGTRVEISSSPELVDAISQFSEAGVLKLEARTMVTATATTSSPEQTGIPIADSTICSQMSRIIDDISLEYNDAIVGSSTKLVLEHIVDNFQDHVTPDFCPSLYGDNDDCYVLARYQINGEEVSSPLLAVDGIYLDMTCIGSILMPKRIAYVLNSNFKGLTACFTKRSDGLLCGHVEINHCSPPSFVRVKRRGEQLFIKNEGSLILNANYWRKRPKNVFKITGIFIISQGYPNWKLKGIRVFSEHRSNGPL
jgi:hypothetical protein